MRVVRDRLATPVGLRSLAPGDVEYKSRYFGDLRSRDAAYHQGTVWAWLAGPYIDAWLKVYPDDWAQLQATYPAMRGQAWDLNGPERRVLSWCALNDVRCVALSPAFLAARDTSPRLHWHFDGHWTPAGHALAAETMAEALRASVQQQEGE